MANKNANDLIKEIEEQKTAILEEWEKLGPIVEQFKTVEKLLKKFPDDAEKNLGITLNNILGQLEHFEYEVQRLLNTIPADTLMVAKVERVRSMVEKAEEEKFSNFLATIGDSVIESQEALDERSIKYLQKIRENPFLPPTLFRIPKISAALKVGLKKTTSEGLNVLIVSRKDEQEMVNEQSINFEIAAVPPPPELLQSLQDKTPKVEFLFSKKDREEIFNSISSMVKEDKNRATEERLFKDAIEKQLELIVAVENQDRVLIWPVKKRKAHFILFAGKESEKDVCIWYLDRSQDKPILESVIRLDLKPKSKENQEPLREFVFNLGKDQAALL